MGKKSKRKGASGKETKVHKERIQQHEMRRLDDRYLNTSTIKSLIQLEKGARVLYNEEGIVTGGESWRRGIITEIQWLDEAESSLDFAKLVLYSSAKGVEDQAMETSDIDRLRFDRTNWVLRFTTGQDVVCCVGPDDVNLTWQLGKVVLTWPGHSSPSAVYEYALYEVNILHPETRNQTVDSHYMYDDKRDSLFEYKMPRYLIGDEVLFSSRLATELRKYVKREPWIRATVTKVDIFGRRDFYSPYQVEFMTGRQRETCFILEDTDECICRADVTPRERFFDAVEQGCDISHLKYLVLEFSLDVASFTELVLAKAIEHASYEALLFLQKEFGLDVIESNDSQGRTLLHLIAASTKASHFIEKAIERKDPKNSDVQLTLGDYVSCRKDNSGRLWIHEMVASENFYALSCVLSLASNFGRSLSMELNYEAVIQKRNMSEEEREAAKSVSFIQLTTRDHENSSPRDLALRAERSDILHMIDEYSVSIMVHKLADTIEHSHYAHSDSVDDMLTELLPRFRCLGISDASIVRSLVYFWRTTSDRHMEKRVHGKLAQAGDVDALRWFFGAISEFPGSNPFKGRYRIWNSRANRDLFTQPELLSESQVKGEEEWISLVSITVHGEDCSGTFTASESDVRTYFLALCASYRSYPNRPGVRKPISLEGLLDYILDRDQKINLYEYQVKALLTLKKKLVQNCNLDNRLRTLEYLVFEKKQPPPSIIDVIRWRQCGVLRWMVDKSFVDLNALALNDHQLRSYKKALFLGSQAIPSAMLVGDFLCCLAVEFDDYQSLHWLLVDKKLQPTTTCHGWNLVHMCAHFGRREIFQFLLSELSEVSALVQMPSSRQNTDGLFAAHLSIHLGFVDLAALLIRCGCPLVDKRGKSVVWHAKKSSHSFVREWGVNKEKPLKLEEDIRKVFKILSSQPVSKECVKDHLSKTKCLDFRRWTEFNYKHFDVPGPMGNTFLETITYCCRSVESGDADLVACVLDSFTEIRYDSRGDSIESDCFFCDDYLGSDACLEMSDVIKLKVIERDEQLPWTQCLDAAWSLRARVVDPRKVNSFFVALEALFHSNSMVSAVVNRKGLSLYRLDALLSLERTAAYELLTLFHQGAPVETIIRHNAIIQGIAATIDDEFHDVAGADRLDNLLVISRDGKINIDTNAFGGVKYGDTHPIAKSRPLSCESRADRTRLWLVLIIEGYDHLVEWSLDPQRSTWNAEREQTAIRVAAFFGHETIVRLFLFPPPHRSASLLSDRLERLKAACFGAAEAGRLTALEFAWNVYLSVDGSLSGVPIEPSQVPSLTDVERKVADTLVGSALFGVLDSIDGFTPIAETIPSIETLLWVFKATSLNPKTVIDIMASDYASPYLPPYLHRFTCLFEFLVRKRLLDIWTCQLEAQKLSDKFIRNAAWNEEKKNPKEQDISSHRVMVEWLTQAIAAGLNIQPIGTSYERDRNVTKYNFLDDLESLKTEQRLQWARFDTLKKGGALKDIRRVFENSAAAMTARDANGLLAVHIAGVYDRIDALSWFVESKGVSLSEKDGSGRTVLQVAVASNASAATEWISKRLVKEKIAAFASSHFRRRRAKQRLDVILRVIWTLQARFRGWVARRKHRDLLVGRLKFSKGFHAIWKSALSRIEHVHAISGQGSWLAMKHELSDMMPSLGEDWERTKNLLSAAVNEALVEGDSEDEEDNEVDQVILPLAIPSASMDQGVLTAQLFPPRMTKYAWKWVEKSDPKYRGFFIAKVKRLAAGDRSRTMAKRLKGTTAKAVFETYLEQKSGHRILWTEDLTDGLIIWFVTTHDRVSRMASLIDKAEQRSSRQLSSITQLTELVDKPDAKGDSCKTPHVLLDP
jgi:ankyrin repeat protein